MNEISLENIEKSVTEIKELLSDTYNTYISVLNKLQLINKDIKKINEEQARELYILGLEKIKLKNTIEKEQEEIYLENTESEEKIKLYSYRTEVLDRIIEDIENL